MNSQPEHDIESLRAALTELKREVAKVIAGMQFVTGEEQRLDLNRRMEACRGVARELTAVADDVQSRVVAPHEQEELDRATRFLAQMRTFGGVQKDEA